MKRHGTRTFRAATLGLALFWAGVIQPLLAQAPPLIDRQLFFGDPEISGAQISPDGKSISFVKPYKDARNIYVKGIDEPFEKARPVTADSRPVAIYFWSRDSRFILYGQDKNGDENFHIYAVDPGAPAEQASGVPPARDLTPLEGIRAFIYSVPKNTPGQILVGLNDRDPAYHDVYRVDLATGERKLLIQNNDKVGGYTFDLDGKVRLAIRQNETGGTDVFRVGGEALKKVYSCSFEETCAPVRFHKDGEHVYMQTNRGEDVDLSRLILFDPETGQEKLVESDPENQVDFGGAVFDNATDELIATVYVGDRVRIYPKDAQLEKDLKLLRRKLPEGELNLVDSSADMRLHLVSVTRDVDPGSVYLYDRKSGKVDLLYRSRPNLPSEHLAPMKALRYQSRDGLEIPAYLTLPKGVEARGLPTVLFPHGGPWARDNWGYDPFAQFLANRGYAVLQPNFRSSTGYGKKFLNAGNKQWGFGAMQHDLTDGVQYLIKEGIADPKRIGIFGGSYGGYATLAGVTFTPDLYAAAIPYVAPSNLITLIESFPAYWGPFIKIWHNRVGDPANEKDRADLMARSPLFKADQIKAPMLVVHGLNDPRVKKTESDQIVVAVRDRGLDVSYLVAPDEGHGFRSPENRLALAVAIERFLAKHLGGRQQDEVSPPIQERLAKLTVDVNSVTLADKTRESYAETAPLPAFRGLELTPVKLTYSGTVNFQGQDLKLDLERTLARDQYQDAPSWRFQSVTQSVMGEGRETLHVHRDTLIPIHRAASQGPASIELSFGADSVQGKIARGPAEVPVQVALAAPVIGDGASLDLALSALPLEEGYEGVVRIFDTLSRKVRPATVKVLGSEELTVPAGTFPTLKVEVKPLDGENGGGVYHIATTGPRCVLRSQTQLPAAAGGSTVVIELTKMETGEVQ